MAGRRGDRPEKVRHRLTGAAGGLLVLALFSLLLWFLSDSEVQLAVTTAFLAGIVIDGVLAHRTVAPVRIDLRSPDEIVAGEPSDWTVQVTGWSRPLTLSPLLAAGTPDVLVRDDRLGTLTWSTTLIHENVGSARVRELGNGTAYQFKVSAVDAFGNESRRTASVVSTPVPGVTPGSDNGGGGDPGEGSGPGSGSWQQLWVTWFPWLPLMPFWP